jgi:hypothetical protein
MKRLLISLGLVFCFVTVSQVSYAEAVVKKVCHIDEKTKKEVCKNIKTHKKLEGTKVPEKKK